MNFIKMNIRREGGNVICKGVETDIRGNLTEFQKCMPEVIAHALSFYVPPSDSYGFTYTFPFKLRSNTCFTHRFPFALAGGEKKDGFDYHFSFKLQ